MKSFGAILSLVAIVGGIITAAPQENDAEKLAKARQRVSQQNELEAQEGPIQAAAPKPAPDVEPTPAPKIDPIPTPAPAPEVAPEGYEIYYEKVCNGQSCVMVKRMRPIAKAAKAVGSVLMAPVRAVQAARCANADCTCDPCECPPIEMQAVQGEVVAVEYRAAPVRTFIANRQPVRTAGRVAGRVATAPVRFVRNLRCR